MHPFEIYKLYLNIKFHFTTKKFLFDYDYCGLKNIRFSTFDGSQNAAICSKLQKIPKEELVELFVSNLVLEPKKPLNFFKYSSVFFIRSEWKKRISNIEEIFMNDLKNNVLSEVYNFQDLKEKLFMKPVIKSIQKIKSFDLILDDSKLESSTTNRMYLDDFILNCHPETIIILDRIYFKKCGQSFLEELLKKEFKPFDDYLKLWKYQFFLDMDKILEFTKIQDFKKIC